ncbi:rho guanine nucleotide exchange factor 7b isoform X5 [Scyliorhinus canicula]|uniref:rho guanine nucleotide exchange factor 7b isoform X5 n=1 Tax=Scyliorhinus canicula TaxID=7830 RepID=UPI0018F34B2A|nr:rho guanine nucleotide exchange factor 7b isoform X5 [Scyliorhinus canicula]
MVQALKTPALMVERWKSGMGKRPESEEYRACRAGTDIGVGSDSVCARHQSHHIKSGDSLTGSHLSLGRTSKNFPGKYRSLDMTDNSNHHMLVKAKFNFYQTNEDELCFNKGDVIHVCRIEDGGWWEGSLNGKNGWFPSNYVREIKSNEKPISPKSATLKSSPKGFETPPISKSYYNVVLQNILEIECDYAEELTVLLSTFLRPLQASDKLSSTDMGCLMGNLEDICSFQQILVQSLEECTKLPEFQQKVGGCFGNLMSQMKSLYLAYCANHPWAVHVLTQFSEELGEFMEMKGATSPGILMLTTSLSKPFMRLDKYPTLLKELERHMEEYHPDWLDIQRSMNAFQSLSSQCQEVRKKKELELQILTETVHGWEGDDIRSLGNVIYMSQVIVQCGNEDKCERYFLLFPHVLLMLSASPRMSAFIYQGKLPLTGLTVTRLDDSDANKNTFEITGSMIERILVSCSSYQDLQEWVDHLQKQTKTPSVGIAVVRQQSVPCYTDLSKSPKTMKKLLPKRKPERKASDEEVALRKSTAALEEDTQILKVIEAYCTSAKTRQTLNSTWQGTDLMHNHVLNDDDLSSLDSPARRCSLSRLEPADLSEDSDYDSIWLAHSYRMGPTTRKSCLYRKESAPQVLLPEEEKIIVEETNSNGQTIIEEKSLVDTVYALKDEVLELKQENKKMKRWLEEEQRARKELEKLVRKVLKNMNDFSWDETNL